MGVVTWGCSSNPEKIEEKPNVPHNFLLKIDQIFHQNSRFFSTILPIFQQKSKFSEIAIDIPGTQS